MKKKHSTVKFWVLYITLSVVWAALFFAGLCCAVYIIRNF